MEIVIVVLLLLIIAALAFAWMKFRPGATGGAGGLPAAQTASAVAAAPPSPPATIRWREVVERHAMATDPHEAAEAELRLQAQANRVAADLHARQASALESGVHGAGGSGYGAPANGYGQPGVAHGYGDTAPAAYGQPVSPYDGPAPADGYADAAPTNAHGQPVSPYDGPPPADDSPGLRRRGRPARVRGRDSGLPGRPAAAVTDPSRRRDR